MALAAEEPPVDVVVRAVRGRCEIVFAGATVSDRALRQTAEGWPEGRPLRVLEPRGADQRCLTKLAFKLSGKGFKSIEFVERAARAD